MQPTRSSSPPHPRHEAPSRSRTALVALAAAACSSVVTLGLSAGPASATETAASPFANLAIFARALSQIEASHVEPPDQDRLVYGAIRGMVETLDPHSSFLDPEEYRILEDDTTGAFAGIGVEIDVRDGWLVVHGVIPGGPAERAGVRAGDRFLALGGRSARDLRLSEAVRIMRGEPGSPVTVRIRREGVEDAVELTITREIIRVDAVETRVLPDRSVYIRIRSFQETATDEVRRALDAAVASTREAGGVSGVLLDMRGNPGGLLDEAVRISDEFLAQGVIVSTRGRDGVVLSEARAERAGTRPDWPVVVLVDYYSASAAEIVAGALQDHHRAVIVGTTTWGKGSVQNLIELPDGSALKLTVARYYTPSGRTIQARGIEPDVRVEQLDADTALRLAQEQPVLSEAMLEGHLEASGRERALEVARDAMRRAATSEDLASFADDYQARIAHQVLRGLVAVRAARER
jgi:carboxyl-terminal processing protease